MKKINDLKLTQEGLENLKKEYRNLQNKRPEVLSRMVAAREQGDLSENAGYHASKEELAQLDHRLRELKYLIRAAKVVKSDHSNKINIGSNVILNDGKNQKSYKIVGQFEADPINGKLSNLSPIGAALLGKKIGDAVSIDVPDGKLTYKIVEIN